MTTGVTQGESGMLKLVEEVWLFSGMCSKTNTIMLVLVYGLWSCKFTITLFLNKTEILNRTEMESIYIKLQSSL